MMNPRSCWISTVASAIALLFLVAVPCECYQYCTKIVGHTYFPHYTVLFLGSPLGPSERLFQGV